MPKSADAFRTISEVAEWLETPAHVLRFWESKFSQVKPVKRAGGRRYYRPADMRLLGGIKTLLHDDGMTIKGVQKLLREKGVKHVAAFSQPLEGEEETVIEGAVATEGGATVVDFQARDGVPAEAAAGETPADHTTAPPSDDGPAAEPAASAPGDAPAAPPTPPDAELPAPEEPGPEHPAPAEQAAPPGPAAEAEEEPHPATAATHEESHAEMPPAPAEAEAPLPAPTEADTGPQAEEPVDAEDRQLELPAFFRHRAPGAEPDPAAAGLGTAEEPPAPHTAPASESAPAAGAESAPPARPLVDPEIPPDPGEDLPARPGALSRLAGLPRPLPAAAAARLAPLRDRLRAALEGEPQSGRG